MLLILAARSVPADIAQQFGRLPPSFLPLGNRRLFALQAEAAFGEPCYMTLPEDFQIAAADVAALEAAGIGLLPQPSRLSLPEAIGNALTRIRPEGALRILYGDTLVAMDEATMRTPDMVAVQDSTANYDWAFVREAEGAEGGLRFSDDPPSRLDSRRVICGYYNFADPDLLATACHEDTIVKALNFYNNHRPLAVAHAEKWLDFGHLPLYFRSKKDLLIKRVFNELAVENHLLLKASDDTAKMRSEAHWYEALPQTLQLHVPRYCGRADRNHRAGYALEYLYAPILSDLAAFGTLPLASWLEIIQACFELLDKFHAIHPPEGSPEASEAFAARFFEDVIVGKTRSRLAAFAQEGGLPADARITLDGVTHPPLAEVAEALIARIQPTRAEDVRFWHGDLFFGNMFYDFTAQRVLCIDPRGQLASGQPCLYGDLRYDLAKLAHSIVGHYDRILLGRSRLIEDGPHDWRLEIDVPPHQADLEAIFMSFVTVTCGVEPEELLSMTALLFLSMLPLHHDRPDLQRHFLAMGLRLAARVQEGQVQEAGASA